MGHGQKSPTEYGLLVSAQLDMKNPILQLIVEAQFNWAFFTNYGGKREEISNKFTRKNYIYKSICIEYYIYKL